MNTKKYPLICQTLVDSGLVNIIGHNGRVGYELTIQGKIAIWDYENWKLTS